MNLFSFCDNNPIYYLKAIEISTIIVKDGKIKKDKKVKNEVMISIEILISKKEKLSISGSNYKVVPKVFSHKVNEDNKIVQFASMIIGEIDLYDIGYELMNIYNKLSGDSFSALKDKISMGGYDAHLYTKSEYYLFGEKSGGIYLYSYVEEEEFLLWEISRK